MNVFTRSEYVDILLDSLKFFQVSFLFGVPHQQSMVINFSLGGKIAKNQKAYAPFAKSEPGNPLYLRLLRFAQI